MKVMEIGIKRPETIPQVIADVMDAGQVWPFTLTLVITEDILMEVNLGCKRPATLPIEISKQQLMF